MVQNEYKLAKTWREKTAIYWQTYFKQIKLCTYFSAISYAALCWKGDKIVGSSNIKSLFLLRDFHFHLIVT